MLNTVQFYYFSPTGGTKKAGMIFCNGIAENVKGYNLCDRENEPEQPDSDLAVFAAPVFGGRIPGVVTESIRRLNGSGTRTVTLAVYGNRAYEDALLELNRTVEEQGFQVTASAALIAQHSMAPEVGKGRPDDADEKEILDFARMVLDKMGKNPEEQVKVPGNIPYKEGMNMPAAPISLPSCTGCGKCEKSCPTGAISVNGNAVATDTEKCILCMACTAVCPEHARILPPPLQQAMKEKLGALKAVRRENEFFL